ncbi:MULTISPECIES: STAS domain-containing protein [unclassified Streptomyces]|uniref:STAS domain-containing protein n=1 Tax=unclassified Streptomyces TaxID=2593676 RepID=UPI0037F80931
MSPLNLTVHSSANNTVVEVVGELDYATASELRELITSLTLRPGQHLVLDLGGMDFCDSSGLTALIIAHNVTEAAGVGLVLAAVPAHTRRVLRTVGLDQIFVIRSTDDAATA